MFAKIELTPNEMAVAQSALQIVFAQARRIPTLDELLHGWARLATAVSEGYDDSIYEYTNDLTKRDRLESLATHLPEPIWSKIAQSITTIDEKFKQATKKLSQPLASNKPATAWWWWHIPAQPSATLAADLESSGFLPPK